MTRVHTAPMHGVAHGAAAVSGGGRPSGVFARGLNIQRVRDAVRPLPPLPRPSHLPTSTPSPSPRLLSL